MILKTGFRRCRERTTARLTRRSHLLWGTHGSFRRNNLHIPVPIWMGTGRVAPLRWTADANWTEPRVIRVNWSLLWRWWKDDVCIAKSATYSALRWLQDDLLHCNRRYVSTEFLSNHMTGFIDSYCGKWMKPKSILNQKVRRESAHSLAYFRI